MTTNEQKRLAEVLVRRYDGRTEWVREVWVTGAHDAWRWAATGDEYGVKYYELYEV
jgi:hypothetical protein